MGRRYPCFEGSKLFIHPIITLPLVAASIIATVAVFFALCASHSRKLSCLSPKSNNSIKKIKTSTASVGDRSPPPTPTCTQVEQQQQQYSSIIYEESSSVQIGPVMTPRRRLSMSLSMKLPDCRMSKICASRRERKEKPEEESIWTKTIILGERCKIPSDDEDDEVAFYDEKGNRQRNYRPRTPRSLPVSRTNSFINVVEVDHP